MVTDMHAQGTRGLCHADGPRNGPVHLNAVANGTVVATHTGEPEQILRSRPDATRSTHIYSPAACA
jgi:hypothetical protein